MFYPGFRGIAQPIRFLLAHLGIKHDNFVVESREAWEVMARRLGAPYDSLPCYMDKETHLVVKGLNLIMINLSAKYQPALIGMNEADQKEII